LPLSGNDGKEAIPKFLFYLVVVFPLWLLVLVPLAILTYPTKFFMNKKKKVTPTTAAVTPSAVVPNERIIPLAERRLDLVIYGATGFTGGLAARYVAKNYGTTIKWAIAGRRAEALATVRAAFAAEAQNPELLKHVEIIVADAHDAAALRALAESTRAVATTAGPFALQGTPLVEQCVRAGTGCCDITGETDWVRTLIDKYDAVARQTGARIVNFCGHDCVPWDLAVMQAAQKLRADHGEDLVSVACYDEIIGTMSGGTVATLLHSLDGRIKYRAALPFDPLMKGYTKPAAGATAAPDADAQTASRSVTVAKNISFLGYDKAALLGRGSWLGPFVMAAVMANCIRRSNAVNNYSGGQRLAYREGMVYPSFMAGFVDLVFGLCFITCLQTPALIALLRLVVPKPGEGPSEAEMDAGFLKVTVQGRGSAGTNVAAACYFPTDPGYRDTARMLVESALALALDGDKLDVGGGVFTPAACQKQVLADRLTATGSQFQVATLPARR
jgi:short subunit dehydrogenase-like uncharacterized protein